MHLPEKDDDPYACHIFSVRRLYTITLFNFVCPDAQSDRRSSFGKRVWFTESRHSFSYFLLL